MAIVITPQMAITAITLLNGLIDTIVEAYPEDITKEEVLQKCTDENAKTEMIDKLLLA